MKKINLFLILFVMMLGFTYPRILPTHTNMFVRHQARNSRTHQLNSIALHTDTMNDDWVIECVDCHKQFNSANTDRGLRLDSDGHPHIVYGGDHLYHAWYDGSTWHTETVDASPRVGYLASLDLDEAGYAHISYFDEYKQALKYAYQNEYGWHTETVAEQVGLGTSNSLGVDSHGHPHISFINETNELQYAHKESDHWEIQTVDPGECRDSSLAVDPDGQPHISYRIEISSDSAHLNYATLNLGNWSIETVDGEGFAGISSTIDLDTDGFPHIVYRSLLPYVIQKNGYDERLNHAFLAADGWSIQGIRYGCYGISFALDRSGEVHVSCTNRGVLYYISQDAGYWQTQTVYDYGMLVLGRSSIDINDLGIPHISYYVGEILDGFKMPIHLRHAILETDGWQNQTIDTAGYVGAKNALALSSDGFAHISYSDKYDQLHYAYQDESGWFTEEIDTEVGYYGKTTLDVSETGQPHIGLLGHIDRYHDGLKYVYQAESGWQVDPVDFYGGMFPTLILDKAGSPHISYEADGIVRHASLTHSGWYTETITGGFSPAMALDQNDYLHISYGATDFRTLYYAYQDESGWYFEYTGGPGEIWYGTSLALDHQSFPHIAYNQKYVFKDELGWHVLNIASSGGSIPSIAMDQQGNPHISYDTYGELVYIYRNESGWHRHIIDGGQVSKYTSLRLDEFGLPHISYEEGGDLKLAYLTGPPDESLIIPSSQAEFGLLGSIITATFQVTNYQFEQHTYDIVLNGNQWPTYAPATIGPIVSGDSEPLEVEVTIPPTATLGSSDTTTITLTSQNDPNVTATAILTTYAAINTYLPLVAR